MELLDIFDKEYNYIGTCEKKQAHIEGKWHQTFNCLFIDSTQNKVYFQCKNSSHNDLSDDNKLDLSVGGHLMAGETIQDGIREIKEESSLDVKYDDLVYLGYRTINLVINENYAIREFNHLHIYDTTYELEHLQSTDDEVIYFVEFDIDELISFIRKKESSIVGRTPKGLKTFTIKDFIEGYLEDNIYIKYLLLAKNFINKEPNLEWNKTLI